jgi:hypothetical protein
MAELWRRAREGWIPHSETWVGWVTRTALVGAFLVGVAGIVRAGPTDYHLDVETLAVFAALTGVYAERRAAAAERQRAAISAVLKELDDNISVLQNDPRFTPQDSKRPEPRLYPRVEVSAAEACLAQNALADSGDVNGATAALSRWRERAETFNRGVNLMELLFFGLHLITPGEGHVMLRVDEELQAQLSEMISETRAIQDSLLSISESVRIADDNHYGTTQAVPSEPTGHMIAAGASLGIPETLEQPP